ncbi:hypothetical protein FPHOBKDP_00069 [Listeria phage LPJP1]|nr:hypothetical protein FPHOBKDP_00069 [Listeria phage LPJP1]
MLNVASLLRSNKKTKKTDFSRMIDNLEKFAKKNKKTIVIGDKDVTGINTAITSIKSNYIIPLIETTTFYDITKKVNNLKSEEYYLQYYITSDTNLKFIKEDIIKLFNNIKKKPKAFIIEIDRKRRLRTFNEKRIFIENLKHFIGNIDESIEFVVMIGNNGKLSTYSEENLINRGVIKSAASYESTNFGEDKTELTQISFNTKLFFRKLINTKLSKKNKLLESYKVYVK